MWSDLLTAYDGDAITYDAVGNPETYRDGMSFVWQNGRQLATYKLNGTTQATYTYNADGVRTSKTASGTTHTYTLSGSTIMREELSSGITLTYLYDESGKRYGVRYQKGTATPRYFYYLYNGQGDVIEIVNSSGATVALYTYDAWGKASVTDASGLAITSTVHIGNVNPFRYRGYYYDQETGFYYLNSRYYDPQTGRFINSDDPGVLTASMDSANYDKNLFAYCDNNPVIRADDGGEFWNIVAGAVVGAAVGLVSSVVSEVIEGDFDWKDLGQVAVSTAIGAIEGAAIALCPGAAVGISAIASVADTAINGAIDGDSLGEIAVNSAISGAIGAAAGTGGSSFIKGGMMNDAVKSVGAVVRKGVHPTVQKTARKTIKKTAKHVGKAYLSGQFEDLTYGGINQFASWYANKVIDRAFL